MTLLAIDPGTTESGWVVLDDANRVAMAGVTQNEQLMAFIRAGNWANTAAGEVLTMAIEVFEPRGMSIGNDSLETILWTGRMIEACRGIVTRVKRSEVKSHVCGTQKATDSNIRQALIDIIGPVGVKANPGPTYLVKSHAWAALGVAATVRGLR